MATTYKKDRFDEVPDDLLRVGAHRSPRRRGSGWVAFAWAVLATLVLVALGAVWILGIDKNINLGFGGAAASPSASASAVPSTTPTVAPTLDPDLSVIVLNGTATAGLAGDVTSTLKDAGWSVDTPTNADSSDVTKTVVYYSKASLEGAAKGVAGSLKSVTIKLSQDYAESADDLTVVIGSDYPLPG